MHANSFNMFPNNEGCHLHGGFQITKCFCNLEMSFYGTQVLNSVHFDSLNQSEPEIGLIPIVHVPVITHSEEFWPLSYEDNNRNLRLDWTHTQQTSCWRPHLTVYHTASQGTDGTLWSSLFLWAHSAPGLGHLQQDALALGWPLFWSCQSSSCADSQLTFRTVLMEVWLLSSVLSWAPAACLLMAARLSVQVPGVCAHFAWFNLYLAMNSRNVCNAFEQEASLASWSIRTCFLNNIT